MKNITGFTLIELMVTIGIVGILLSVAVPNLRLFMQDGRLTTTNNELVSAMQVARSGALQFAASACVCPSVTADTASPSCSGASTWETGWISFVDVNTASVTECVFDATDGDILLKAWNDSDATANGITVRTTSATINAFNYVRFNSRGAPITSTGSGLQGMFVICDDRGLTGSSGSVIGNAVILSAPGSLRSTREETVIVSCL